MRQVTLMAEGHHTLITAKPRSHASPLAAKGSTTATAGMPPFRLPGEHFAAALVWLVIGAGGLIAVAPSLAASGFLAPHAIAVTHAFTLGWITTSIFGALYQLFPVALGVPARSVTIGHVTFGTLQTGIVMLVAAAWWWWPAGMVAGWTLLAAAVGGLAWNILPQRRRAPRGQQIGRFLVAAHIGLGLAMGVVGVRIGQSLGWWPANRLGLLVAHVHLALLGFATLTVVGVGSRLFPMFLLSRGHAEWPLRWIVVLVLGGVTILSVGAIWGLAALRTIGGIATVVGIGLYLWLASTYYRRRTRRKLDPGLAHAAVALVFLAAATAVGVILLLVGFEARLATSYALLGVIGWLTMLVVGMYYKIVPFLSWLHRFSARVGEPNLPKVADLTWPRAGWITLGLLTTGVATAAIAVGLGSELGARIGSVFLAGGVGLVALQHLHIATVRPRP